MTDKTNISVGFKAEATMMQIFASNSLNIIFELDALPTGNLFVEYQKGNENSGISKSDADWWRYSSTSTGVLLYAPSTSRRCAGSTSEQIMIFLVGIPKEFYYL